MFILQIAFFSLVFRVPIYQLLLELVLLDASYTQVYSFVTRRRLEWFCRKIPSMDVVWGMSGCCVKQRVPLKHCIWLPGSVPPVVLVCRARTGVAAAAGGVWFFKTFTMWVLFPDAGLKGKWQNTAQLGNLFLSSCHTGGNLISGSVSLCFLCSVHLSFSFLIF